MENEASILASLRAYQHIRHFSTETIKLTEEGSRFFFRFMGKQEVKEIQHIGRTHLLAYLDFLYHYVTKKGTPYTIQSICARVRSVKRLFAFLETTKVIIVNPAADLREPRVEKRILKVILTEAQTDHLLETPDVTKSVGLRNRAVLEVLYSTGIRLNELVHLRLGDVDLKNGLLRVNQGKGNKDRMVPLGQVAVRWIQAYLMKVRLEVVKEENHLFLNRAGIPLSKQMVEIMVRKTAKQAGILERVTPHVFRHSFATQLVRNGADILMVSQMLGHTRVDTTQIYVRAAGVDVKKTHQGSHPREKMQEAEVKPTNVGYFHHV